MEEKWRGYPTSFFLAWGETKWCIKLEKYGPIFSCFVWKSPFGRVLKVITLITVNAESHPKPWCASYYLLLLMLLSRLSLRSKFMQLVNWVRIQNQASTESILRSLRVHKETSSKHPQTIGGTLMYLPILNHSVSSEGLLRAKPGSPSISKTYIWTKQTSEPFVFVWLFTWAQIFMASFDKVNGLPDQPGRTKAG